mmetsp:Transcript_4182/g.9996  ORF Transcript_4182/g.9996 Transcript_4182/m.9996 type:complete len:80 (-) Transcript_4182:844-1083(-)
MMSLLTHRKSCKGLKVKGQANLIWNEGHQMGGEDQVFPRTFLKMFGNLNMKTSNSVKQLERERTKMFSRRFGKNATLPF